MALVAGGGGDSVPQVHVIPFYCYLPYGATRGQQESPFLLPLAVGSGFLSEPAAATKMCSFSLAWLGSWGTPSKDHHPAITASTVGCLTIGIVRPVSPLSPTLYPYRFLVRCTVWIIKGLFAWDQYHVGRYTMRLLAAYPVQCFSPSRLASGPKGTQLTRHHVSDRYRSLCA